MDGIPVIVPERVAAARRAAAATGFDLSSDDAVGRLLSVLAAAVPAGGRILELGTGAGVGTAWLVHGLGSRADVELVTVEVDRPVAERARRGAAWPGWVTFVVDDAVAALHRLGHFDLVFADARGGKWERLDLTVAALGPGGVLVADDMTPQPWWSAAHGARVSGVRDTLLGHPDLGTCELEWASGVIVAVRSRRAT